MIIGTTPLHIFDMSCEPEYDKSEILKVKITYKQNDEIIVVKREQDCEINDTDIRTRLTQADTFKFDPDQMVKVQIRVKTMGGDILSSYSIEVTAAECLDDEEL